MFLCCPALVAYSINIMWKPSTTLGVAPCVAAGRVLQRLSFFAVFIAFSLTVLVMSYTIFCVVAPGTQRCVLFRRLRSIFRVFARLKFAR